MTCHYIKTDRDGTSWCGLAEQNGRENSELRARIAALSAPPTEAEILDAAQKIYEVKKAIGLACMYEGGAKKKSKAEIDAMVRLYRALSDSSTIVQSERTLNTRPDSKLIEALERQCDNMAFILNRADVGNLYDKFCEELKADREALRHQQRK